VNAEGGKDEGGREKLWDGGGGREERTGEVEWAVEGRRKDGNTKRRGERKDKGRKGRIGGGNGKVRSGMWGGRGEEWRLVLYELAEELWQERGAE